MGDLKREKLQISWLGSENLKTEEEYLLTLNATLMGDSIQLSRGLIAKFTTMAQAIAQTLPLMNADRTDLDLRRIGNVD
jgi:hypothetical protein